eukprot:Em0006g392a
MGMKVLVAGETVVKFEIEKSHTSAAVCHAHFGESVEVPGRYSQMQVTVGTNKEHVMTGRMLVQLLNPSPVPAIVNKHERIGSLYPLDESGDTCAKHTVAGISVVHEHKADSIMEQMVMSTEGLIDEEKDKLRRLLLLVKKKDGSTRFCVDFRQVNAVTRKDAQPLPRIDDTLDVLGSAKWFSSLDLASGYWQVEVCPEDREKTAFVTPYGLFQFRVMPFGLTNAPATFQRLMEEVLSGLHWTTCLVYLDDILIFSATIEDHLVRLRDVLDRLKNAGLKIKPSNSHLMRKSIKYLGHVVSEHGIKTDPEKTRCVADWPTPSNAHELRQFLGLAGYYRRFVKNFAVIAAPLFHLTENHQAWNWTLQCNAAFFKLKESLVTSPVLAYPVFSIGFVVDTDASGEGLGAVLSQNIEGHDHVISYASRTLNKAERKYCATRREMLALVWAIQHFRAYLYGKRFTVRTDHSSLKWLQSFHEPEGQVARWLETLSEYDFEVLHRPGKKHTNADSLSRMPCSQCRLPPEDNEDQGCVLAVTDSWMPSWTHEELAAHQRQDPDLKQVIKWLETKTLPKVFPKNASSHVKALWSQCHHLVMQNKILYRQWEDVQGRGLNKTLQLVLPSSLVPAVLEGLHSSLVGGHMGAKKTLDKVRCRFYWVGQRKDITQWCISCPTCCSRKTPIPAPCAPMQLDPVERPLQRVAMDILGPLPETEKGNKYILVIGDYFTKWKEAYPLPNMEAMTVARHLVSEFMCRFGVPEQLHSDQGRNFESGVIKGICELLQVRKTRTTPYHPQSDGMVERFNRTLLNLLSLSVSENERDWDVKLPVLLFAYRTSVHETTGVTPFSMMLGREARLPEDLIYGLPVGGAPVPQGGREYVEHLKKAMQNAYKSIRDEAWKEMQHQKNVYDERQNERQCYQKGDFVWLHCPAVPRGHSPKFHRPWHGPYEVEEKLGDVVYRIRKNRQAKQLTVHFNRLKPYTQPVMGHPTGETIEEQRKPEGRRGEPVNREDYLDEEMFIVTSEPARPVVTSERMPEANTETPTPQEPQCNVPIPTDHQPDVPQLRRSTRVRRPPDRL